jgi:hypothetical protein
LLNLVEILASENEELKVENQQLKNEVNILKGELGKPDIKPQNSHKKDTDISSEKERKEGANDDNGESDSTSENPKNKKRIRQSKLAEVRVDREHLCKIDRSTLPSDAVNKGHSAHPICFAPIIVYLPTHHNPLELTLPIATPPFIKLSPTK